MKTKNTKTPRKVSTPSSRAPVGGVCLATVAQWSKEKIAITLPHAPGEIVEARVMLPPGVVATDASVAVGQSVVVMLDKDGPVILGLLQPVGQTGISKTQMQVEERRVEISAEDEIVLTCGEASLVMRKNGRILLRGVQIESRAKGLNRVKGGTVAIN
jgi:hypothetical protein